MIKRPIFDDRADKQKVARREEVSDSSSSSSDDEEGACVSPWTSPDAVVERTEMGFVKVMDMHEDWVETLEAIDPARREGSGALKATWNDLLTSGGGISSWRVGEPLHELVGRLMREEGGLHCEYWVAREPRVMWTEEEHKLGRPVPEMSALMSSLRIAPRGTDDEAVTMHDVLLLGVEIKLQMDAALEALPCRAFAPGKLTLVLRVKRRSLSSLECAFDRRGEPEWPPINLYRPDAESHRERWPEDGITLSTMAIAAPAGAWGPFLIWCFNAMDEDWVGRGDYTRVFEVDYVCSFLNALKTCGRDGLYRNPSRTRILTVEMVNSALAVLGVTGSYDNIRPQRVSRAAERFMRSGEHFPVFVPVFHGSGGGEKRPVMQQRNMLEDSDRDEEWQWRTTLGATSASSSSDIEGNATQTIGPLRVPISRVPGSRRRRLHRASDSALFLLCGLSIDWMDPLAVADDHVDVRYAGEMIAVPFNVGRMRDARIPITRYTQYLDVPDAVLDLLNNTQLRPRDWDYSLLRDIVAWFCMWWNNATNDVDEASPRRQRAEFVMLRLQQLKSFDFVLELCERLTLGRNLEQLVGWVASRFTDRIKYVEAMMLLVGEALSPTFTDYTGPPDSSDGVDANTSATEMRTFDSIRREQTFVFHYLVRQHTPLNNTVPWARGHWGNGGEVFLPYAFECIFETLRHCTCQLEENIMMSHLRMLMKDIHLGIPWSRFVRVASTCLPQRAPNFYSHLQQHGRWVDINPTAEHIFPMPRRELPLFRHSLAQNTALSCFPLSHGSSVRLPRIVSPVLAHTIYVWAQRTLSGLSQVRANLDNAPFPETHDDPLLPPGFFMGVVVALVEHARQRAQCTAPRQTTFPQVVAMMYDAAFNMARSPAIKVFELMLAQSFPPRDAYGRHSWDEIAGEPAEERPMTPFAFLCRSMTPALAPFIIEIVRPVRELVQDDVVSYDLLYSRGCGSRVLPRLFAAPWRWWQSHVPTMQSEWQALPGDWPSCTALHAALERHFVPEDAAAAKSLIPAAYHYDALADAFSEDVDDPEVSAFNFTPFLCRAVLTHAEKVLLLASFRVHKELTHAPDSPDVFRNYNHWAAQMLRHHYSTVIQLSGPASWASVERCHPVLGLQALIDRSGNAMNAAQMFLEPTVDLWLGNWNFYQQALESTVGNVRELATRLLLGRPHPRPGEEVSRETWISEAVHCMTRVGETNYHDLDPTSFFAKMVVVAVLWASHQARESEYLLKQEPLVMPLRTIEGLFAHPRLRLRALRGILAHEDLLSRALGASPGVFDLFGWRPDCQLLRQMEVPRWLKYGTCGGIMVSPGPLLREELRLADFDWGVAGGFSTPPGDEALPHVLAVLFHADIQEGARAIATWPGPLPFAIMLCPELDRENGRELAKFAQCIYARRKREPSRQFLWLSDAKIGLLEELVNSGCMYDDTYIMLLER